MDPDETLRQLRAAMLNSRRVHDAREYPPDEAWTQLLEAAEVLDGWLSNGGFLPLAWQNHGGLKSPENPQHVITIEGPIAYPGGKDGTFRAHCSAGDYTSDFEFSEPDARSAGDAHVRGVTS